ncbi:MAG: hypothetical protein M1281_19180 [Chloroflexi bacterium]|nr:hypothetical protein [Chloroflexota bacterium]
MNFPMQLPVFSFFYWLVNTPGLGGICIALLSGGAIIVGSLIVRWVQGGGDSGESETYSYPTPALHKEE